MPEYSRKPNEFSDGCHNRLWITVFFTMLPGAGVGETSRPRSLKSGAAIDALPVGALALVGFSETKHRKPASGPSSGGARG